MTREILRSAKMAHSTYRQRLDYEKEEKERQLEKNNRKNQSCKEKTEKER
jgi:hypothetical protein